MDFTYPKDSKRFDGSELIKYTGCYPDIDHRIFTVKLFLELVDKYDETSNIPNYIKQSIDELFTFIKSNHLLINLTTPNLDKDNVFLYALRVALSDNNCLRHILDVSNEQAFKYIDNHPEIFTQNIFILSAILFVIGLYEKYDILEKLSTQMDKRALHIFLSTIGLINYKIYEHLIKNEVFKTISESFGPEFNIFLKCTNCNSEDEIYSILNNNDIDYLAVLCFVRRFEKIFNNKLIFVPFSEDDNDITDDEPSSCSTLIDPSLDSTSIEFQDENTSETSNLLNIILKYCYMNDEIAFETTTEYIEHVFGIFYLK